MGTACRLTLQEPDQTLDVFLAGNDDHPVTGEDLVIRTGNLYLELVKKGNDDGMARPLDFPQGLAFAGTVQTDLDLNDTCRLSREVE